MTVFLTTHYMEEAAAADDVVILEKGEICAQGTPDELKSRYGHDTLKLYFSDIEAGYQNCVRLGYQPVRRGESLSLAAADSQEALKILNAAGEFQEFEFIKGSMDDVFLAVTGRREEVTR